MIQNMDWEAERTTVTDTETLTAALAAAPQLLEAAACKQPHHVQALPAKRAMLLALRFWLPKAPSHYRHGSKSGLGWQGGRHRSCCRGAIAGCSGGRCG